MLQIKELGPGGDEVVIPFESQATEAASPEIQKVLGLIVKVILFSNLMDQVRVFNSLKHY